MLEACGEEVNCALVERCEVGTVFGDGTRKATRGIEERFLQLSRRVNFAASARFAR